MKEVKQTGIKQSDSKEKKNESKEQSGGGGGKNGAVGRWRRGVPSESEWRLTRPPPARPAPAQARRCLVAVSLMLVSFWEDESRRWFGSAVLAALVAGVLFEWSAWLRLLCLPLPSLSLSFYLYFYPFIYMHMRSKTKYTRIELP